MAKEDKSHGWLSLRKALAYFKRLWPFLKPQWPQMLLLLAGVVMTVWKTRPTSWPR
jgi:hypothetical protein